MNDLRDLIDLYCTPPAPYTGPRLFVLGESSGYRVLDAKRDTLDNIVQEVGVYCGVHREACLDTWARRIDNQRMFCPLIDCTLSRGTPPPLKASGIIECGPWTVYLWALEQRVPFAEYDRVEQLRFALATRSVPRRPVEDGFTLPGSVYGIAESTRTQIESYYSYGEVHIPLRGVTEQRTTLVHFDAAHRVRLDELEQIAPHVSKPRSMAEALTQSVSAQLARR